MKFGKRLLPILLTLSMGLSLLPSAALAAQAQANAAAQNQNISVDGVLAGEAFVYIQGEASWFRLRDVAYALEDTAAAFDLTWDGGVVLTRGSAYTGEPVEDSTMPPAFSAVTLTVQVDGQTVEVPAVLMTPGNYCVTAEGLAALLGLSVTETAGEVRPGLLIATA